MTKASRSAAEAPGAVLKPLRVLLIEDSADDAALVLAELRRSGYAPEWERIDNARTMQAALAGRIWDCVLSDYELPGFSGPAALQLLQAHNLDLPFIVVSGAISEDTAVTAMKAGAHDYIMKDSLSRLGPAIERERREAEMRQERRLTAAELAADSEVSSAIAGVGQALIATLGTTTQLESLCQATATALACDSSHTLFWQAEEQVLKPIAMFGASPEEREIGQVVHVPRAFIAGLLRRLEDDDVSEVEASELVVMPQPCATQRLCMALRRGQELIGVQIASRTDDGVPFSETQRRIGRRIAQMASLALEHARVVQALERSNRLKSDFVATMSHELRTPLNIIMGYNELALEGEFGALNSEQTMCLQHIGASARNLLDLINATLDLARLEKEQVPLDLAEMMLPELIRELADETGQFDGKSTLQFIWDLPAALPSLHTDRIKLKIVLRNLIANAAKFTETGSVTVRAGTHDGGVEIAVIDTGIGIAPEILPIIFEAFRQGDSSSTRLYGGVGLGLYIVRRLVDLLGGKITVESQLQRGSTFRVWLPRKASAQPGAAA